MCGPTLTELVAVERGISPAEAGPLRSRFPAKPVTLGEIASLPVTPEALAAVDRPPGGTH